ncbi:MAG TPA: hypothetical protein PKA41_04890 [Verrucomicrobiota bacterium]|nr:hypothetical protein [Verrucomicrobiota bacterium]
MNITAKFSCIYCGQHMECETRHSGRQILCPACLHRLVIPKPRSGGLASAIPSVPETWDTDVPLPQLDILTATLSPSDGERAGG